MNTTEITKTINLLKENRQGDAIEFLKSMILKTTSKQSYNLFNEIKRYLKNVDEGRPVLKKLQTNETTKNKVIINGMSAIEFLKYDGALSNFEIAKEEENFNIERLYFNKQFQDIQGDDFLLFNNIAAVKKFLETEINKKEDKPCIKLFGKYFDTNLIEPVVKIGGVPDKVAISDDGLTFILINENVKSIILPLRIIVEELKEKIDGLTDKILEKLKKEGV